MSEINKIGQIIIKNIQNKTGMSEYAATNSFKAISERWNQLSNKEKSRVTKTLGGKFEESMSILLLESLFE